MTEPPIRQPPPAPVAPSATGLRTAPKQQRAAETVERLLAASSALIEERGIEGFNTNLLAERCDMRVRSVYRYFDNKQAIVATLYRRLTESWHPFFDARFERIGDPALDWRREVDALATGFGALVLESPSGTAIRRAMKSDATLIDIERADNVLLGERFAAAVSRRVPSASHDQLARVGRTWLNAVSLLMDIALDCGPDEQARQFDETLVLQRAYLATYLDPAPD